MPVEVAHVEEVGSLGKIVLMLFAVEAGAVKKGSGFLPCHHGVCHQGVCHKGVCNQGGPSRRVPSKRVLSRQVQDLAIKAGAGS